VIETVGTTQSLNSNNIKKL